MISPKEKILNAIRVAKTSEETALPDLSALGFSFEDPVETFSQMLRSVGGEAVLLGEESMDEVIRSLYPDARVISSSVEGCRLGTIKVGDPHDLRDLDLAIIQGEFAVAENGAVWVEEGDDRHRATAFIAENIVLVVDKASIVDTMHDAYAQIGFKKSGFGVFISGPSKTADIEQALVIGAHGAKSLYVLLVSQ